MKTYCDAGVFFRAFRGDRQPEEREKAHQLLDAEELVVSVWLQLEVLAKPTAYRRADELAFYAAYLPTAPLPADPAAVALAWKLAARHGLGALDALHVAAALAGGARQFVTTEADSKPLFRVRELRVVALADYRR